MIKIIWTVLMGIFILASSAFASEADIEGCRNINTIAGPLHVLDADGMKSDGLYDEVKLNGAVFDKLYGFTDSCVKHTLADGLVDRMLMYDFNNGGGRPPTISLYDFREKPAVAIPIDGPMLIENVKWVPEGVVLKLRGEKYYGWYKFDGEKLLRIKRPKL
jgi:hypothetical protein